MTAPGCAPDMRGYTRGAGLPNTWVCADCGAARIGFEGSQHYGPGKQLRRCAQCVGWSPGGMDAAIRALLLASPEPIGPQAVDAALRASHGIAVQRKTIEKALYRVGERVGRGRYVAREVTP